MDIKIIKDILDDAKECGCIAGISLSNGQLTHANFSKSKLFDFTADVLYNKKKHLIPYFNYIIIWAKQNLYITL